MPSVSPVSQRATIEPNWETYDPVILYICKYTVEVHDSFKCTAADIATCYHTKDLARSTFSHLTVSLM